MSSESLKPESVSFGSRLDALEGEIFSNWQGIRPELTAILHAAQAGFDTRIEARALCLLGGCAYHDSDFETTVIYCGEALPLCRAVGDSALEARVLNALGLAKQGLQLYDEALEFFLESLRIAERLEDQVARLRTLNNIAQLYQKNDNLAQAQELQREALELAERLGQPHYVGACLTSLISIHADLNDHAEVLRLSQQALPIVREHLHPTWESWLVKSTAHALLELGRTQEAYERSLEGLRQAQERQDSSDVIALGQVTGEILSRQSRHAEAVTLLQDTLRLSEEVGNVLHQSQTHLLLSRLAEARGRYKQALKHTQAHFALERQLHARDLQTRTQSLAGQVHMELLKREAEIERLRNVELAQANRDLQVTQSALLRQANRDPLTNLLNHTHFKERVQQALQVQPGGTYSALIFVDLDEFKAVNDTYGHATGDLLLKLVARRLKRGVRSKDLVGRMGGDEFLVFLRKLSHPDDAYQISQKLLGALREPYALAGRTIEVSASLGYTIAPSDGMDAEGLLRHADLAMYHVKRTGRNDSTRFTPFMSEERQKRQRLERELRGAEQRGELELQYQPRFAVQDQQLTGFEALLRWNHPQMGLVLPGNFIHLAEETRLIVQIGAWVLEQSCAQAQKWNFAAQNLSMSVNVSPMQFEQPDFVDQVRATLELTGLPAHTLILELTESLVMQDLKLAKRHILELQGMGVQVAMDDFGTGYSSLSILQTLPFNHLKIDRSFLQGLATGTPHAATSRMLMEVMIQLAHNLNMQVTAEGVESQSQVQLLRDLGCDHTQGFFLAKPVPAWQAERHLPSLAAVPLEAILADLP